VPGKKKIPTYRPWKALGTAGFPQHGKGWVRKATLKKAADMRRAETRQPAMEIESIDPPKAKG